MTKYIQLTIGGVTMVDDDDYEYLDQYAWRKKITCTGYEMIVSKISSKMVIMARLIMKANSDEHVDHINFDSCDNRRSNLRLCSPLQNAHHRRPLGGKSKYKGVYKAREKWAAAIWYKHVKYYLGTFTWEVDAALAYNLAAARYYGEFAYYNTIGL